MAIENRKSEIENVMHSSSTRHDFLKLRAQGHSLASIGRQLSVSKPTLIKWNRDLQGELTSALTAAHQAALAAVATDSETEAAALRRRIAAVKQELFSRSIRELPTPILETMLGSLQDRLRSLPTFQTHNPQPSTRDPEENETQSNPIAL